MGKKGVTLIIVIMVVIFEVLAILSNNRLISMYDDKFDERSGDLASPAVLNDTSATVVNVDSELSQSNESTPTVDADSASSPVNESASSETYESTTDESVTEESITDESKTEESETEKSETADPYKEPRPHPHAGARYPDGKYGYVPDVTFVRKRHLELYSNKEYPVTTDVKEFDYICNKTPGEGLERKGLKIMMEKVQIGGPTPQPNTTNSTALEEETKDEAPLPKVLCIIYTYEKNHDRLEALTNTWGWKCDGFFAASTLTNDTIGAIDLPHLGEEAYNNMWQKTRSIWSYVHDNYMDDYDFFWLGGDDFYLIVENLINYLATIHKPDNEEPLLLGHQIPRGKSNFCGGGPGYVLNKMAVKRLIKDALPTCYPQRIISAEDRFLSICLESIGIPCTSTADAKGQQRFVGMDPNFVATYNGDRGYFKRVWEYWGANTGRFKRGIDLVSEQMNGWHNLRTPRRMIRIHTIHHPESCPLNSTVAKVMAKLMNKAEIEKK